LNQHTAVDYAGVFRFHGRTLLSGDARLRGWHARTDDFRPAFDSAGLGGLAVGHIFTFWLDTPLFSLDPDLERADRNEFVRGALERRVGQVATGAAPCGQTIFNCW